MVDMILVVWLLWLISKIMQMRTYAVDENWIVEGSRRSRRWGRDGSTVEHFETNTTNTLA